MGGEAFCWMHFSYFFMRLNQTTTKNGGWLGFWMLSSPFFMRQNDQKDHHKKRPGWNLVWIQVLIGSLLGFLAAVPRLKLVVWVVGHGCQWLREGIWSSKLLECLGLTRKQWRVRSLIAKSKFQCLCQAAKYSIFTSRFLYSFAAKSIVTVPVLSNFWAYQFPTW